MVQQDRGRIVPPTPTGDRATVMMTVHVMVEVNETDDYNDMVRQAKAQLQKRILEAKGFYPFRSQCDTLYLGIEVDDLKYRTEVGDGKEW